MRRCHVLGKLSVFSNLHPVLIIISTAKHLANFKLLLQNSVLNNTSDNMEIKSKLTFLLALLIASTYAQQQQPEFRQNNQEPQFAPPPQVAPISAQFGSFQQTQQQPLQPAVGQQRQNAQFPQSAQPQQQQQQQRPQQFNNFPQSAQPSQPQANFNDFAAFNDRQQGQQETLPTLPPVFIPPNSPQGPPPQLQSPIRNLFRQPSDNNFSLSNIISRFLNLFNLNNN